MLIVSMIISVLAMYQTARLRHRINLMSAVVDLLALDHLKHLEQEMRQMAKDKAELEQTIERILREEG